MKKQLFLVIVLLAITSGAYAMLRSYDYTKFQWNVPAEITRTLKVGDTFTVTNVDPTKMSPRFLKDADGKNWAENTFSDYPGGVRGRGKLTFTVRAIPTMPIAPAAQPAAKMVEASSDVQALAKETLDYMNTFVRAIRNNTIAGIKSSLERFAGLIQRTSGEKGIEIEKIISDSQSMREFTKTLKDIKENILKVSPEARLAVFKFGNKITNLNQTDEYILQLAFNDIIKLDDMEALRNTLELAEIKNNAALKGNALVTALSLGFFDAAELLIRSSGGIIISDVARELIRKNAASDRRYQRLLDLIEKQAPQVGTLSQAPSSSRPSQAASSRLDEHTLKKVMIDNIAGSFNLKIMRGTEKVFDRTLTGPKTWRAEGTPGGLSFQAALNLKNGDIITVTKDGGVWTIPVTITGDMAQELNLIIHEDRIELGRAS